MFQSIVLISLSCVLLAKVAKQLQLPNLLAYLIVGMVLGPSLLNLIHPHLLKQSATIRQISLIIILLRTGLNLNLEDVKTIGIPALLMSFIPALFEIAAITLLAPLFFEISRIDAAILGSILAAVSPAVIIPRMITSIDQGFGQVRKIPQLVMASASLDDIFALVLFDSLLALKFQTTSPATGFILLPIKILFGVLLGVSLGFIINKLASNIKGHTPFKTMLILFLSYFLVVFETPYYSGLLAIMSLGFTLVQQQPRKWISTKQTTAKLWIIAEAFLFTIVGANVTMTHLGSILTIAIPMIGLALGLRSLGVWLALLPSQLSPKEKLFTMVSFIPKATVQAALGAIPLSLGFESGALILSLSVIVILLTAPLGAIAIDALKPILLTKDTSA